MVNDHDVPIPHHYSSSSSMQLFFLKFNLKRKSAIGGPKTVFQFTITYKVIQNKLYAWLERRCDGFQIVQSAFWILKHDIHQSLWRIAVQLPVPVSFTVNKQANLIEDLLSNREKPDKTQTNTTPPLPPKRCTVGYVVCILKHHTQSNSIYYIVLQGDRKKIADDYARYLVHLARVKLLR